MAGPYYCDDGGDDSDGSTWAKAKNALDDAIALASAAGDTIYVGSDSTDTAAASRTFAFANGTVANPIKLISAVPDSDPPTYENQVAGGGIVECTGAASDMTITGNAIVHGLKCDCADLLYLGSAGLLQRFVDCYLKSVDNVMMNNSSEGIVEFIGCSLEFTDYITMVGDSDTYLKDCTVVKAHANAIFSFSTADSIRLVIEDSDLSTEATVMTTMAAERVTVDIRRSELHASPDWPTDFDHPGTYLHVESSIGGTDTDPIIGMQYYANMYGVIEDETTEYRTGGASDGTTPFCWKLISNSTNCWESHLPLQTPPMYVRVAAGAQTIKVFVAGETQLQNDEFWIEVSSANESSPATSQGRFQTSLPATILTSPTNLTAEGADNWQATPTHYQYATVSIAPEEAGDLIVRACLAKNGTAVTCYVDPLPEVT